MSSNSDTKEVKDNYKIELYPPLEKPTLDIGDEVWTLKKKRIFARAKVLENVDDDQSSPYYGRVKVGFVFGDNSVYHCKPQRLVKVNDATF